MSVNSISRASAKVARNRPALERMLEIHRHLRDGLSAPHLREGAGERKNATFFAKILEYSPKTVVRDLAFMRDRMNLPVAYDECRYTYYYTREVTEFPLMKITEGELTALFVAKAALHQYKGAPYEAALRSALEKLEGTLKSEMEVDLDAISRAISFRSAGSPVPDMALFERLADAVMHRKVVSFDYRKGLASATERRTVRPYHLAHYGTRWYLVAFDEARRELRQFILGRISGAKVETRRFPMPTDFSAEAYYRNSFGVFVAGGEHEVRLKFNPVAAEVVLEGDWHPSQRFTPLKSGELEMSLCVSSLDEVARWVLSFGGDAEVIAPAELRAKVRDLACGLANRHG